MIRTASSNAQPALEERERIYKMLENYVPKTSYGFPIPARILNVGCGQCLESYGLIDYFGKDPYGTSSKNTELIGIDLDRKSLIKAREINGNSEFIRMDARTMDKYFNCKFDVVMTRHSNVYFDTDRWRKIYEKILFLLNSGGILIITNFEQREFRSSVEIIEDLGYKVKVKEKNLFYEERNIPGIFGGVFMIISRISKDDWIIIAEKA